ncbi:MAG: amidohydrolase [Dehalococcoidia bacterium]
MSALFAGGRVHTGAGGSAEALLERDGRVVAVGRLADLTREAGSAERIDLRGGLMVPGWGDAHVHFMWWSIQSAQVDLSNAATLDEALSRVGAAARARAAGAGVLGGRFDKNLWGRWPTAAELDRVTGDRPTSLRSRDGHARWLNSAALRLAGITRTTQTPAGGEIERDANGAPTGILKENALGLIDAAVPPPTADECLAAVRRGQTEAWRRGVVAIEDLEGANARGAFARLHEEGALGIRVDMGIPRADLTSAIESGRRSGEGDEWLRTGHCKIFTDGALGSQTAALEEPYEGTDTRGILTIEPDECARDVARAAAAGIAVAIHAIGDRAVRVALDAIEPTRRSHPELRQRVEHVQLVREGDLARFGRLGVIASMQPIHATSDRELVDRHWGPRRALRAYPWRTLASHGAVLAFGSDAPVEPIDPLLGIHAAVARQRPGDPDRWHPEQALELDEALAAYSAGFAYATGRERERGTLAPGMACDAAVIDRDLAQVDPSEWPQARVTATITGGVVRFAEGLG